MSGARNATLVIPGMGNETIECGAYVYVAATGAPLRDLDRKNSSLQGNVWAGCLWSAGRGRLTFRVEWS